MKILITGASGFVGHCLIKSLQENNWQAVALKREDISGNHGDINSQLFQNADCLVHLAGRAHASDKTIVNVYPLYAAANIDYSIKVANFAVQHQVKRFIYISSIKVNGESSANHAFTELDTPRPEDAYGKTKFEAEKVLSQIAHGSSMALTIIRPPLVYGHGVKANFKNLIKLCQSKLPLPFGAIHNQRSMIYVGNLVAFIETCITHPNAANQTFLVSDDEDVSTTELIRTIRQALGLPVWLVPIPQLWIVFILKLIGKSSVASRLCGNLQVDIGKAKKMLGWRPPYSVRQGIHHTIHQQPSAHDKTFI